jgi:hypothetical protein
LDIETWWSQAKGERREDSAVFAVAYFDAILEHDVLVAGLVRLLLPHPLQLLDKHTVRKV